MTPLRPDELTYVRTRMAEMSVEQFAAALEIEPAALRDLEAGREPITDEIEFAAFAVASDAARDMGEA